MKRNIAAFVILAVGLSGPIPAAANTEVVIATPKDYKLVSRTNDGKDVSVHMVVVTTPRFIPYKGYLGVGLSAPATLVAKVDIEVAGRKLSVPMSVYADLGDPRQASLILEQNETKLVLVGGDGAEGYRVVVSFAHNLVLSREVFGMLEPNQASQKTVYSLVELKDE